MSALTTVAKATSELAVSIGVGAIVGNAIKATTPEGLKTYKKISIAFGSLVVSSMLSSKANEYVENTVKTAYKGVKTARDEAKNKLGESE